MDKPEFIITSETGKTLINWCNDGVNELNVAINEMETVATIDDLKVIWSKYKHLQTENKFIEVKDKRKNELTPKN